MVSNRSSYRAGTSSREGGRGSSALVSETPQDDFFQPGDGGADENTNDDKSVLGANDSTRKTKKGKKKKKKKATQLASIGEDMLDSPVQSADEGASGKQAARAGQDEHSNSKLNDDAATDSQQHSRQRDASQDDVGGNGELEDNNNSGADNGNNDAADADDGAFF